MSGKQQRTNNIIGIRNDDINNDNLIEFASAEAVLKKQKQDTHNKLAQIQILVIFESLVQYEKLKKEQEAFDKKVDELIEAHRPLLDARDQTKKRIAEEMKHLTYTESLKEYENGRTFYENLRRMGLNENQIQEIEGYRDIYMQTADSIRSDITNRRKALLDEESDMRSLEGSPIYKA